MDVKEYIDSGILELYVYGALPEEESVKVSSMLKQNPEVKEEVEAIEQALQQLAMGLSPYDPQKLLDNLLLKFNDNSKVISINKKDNTSRIIMYISIAATLALLVGIVSLLNKNKALQHDVEVVETQNRVLITEIEESNAKLATSKQIIELYRDTDLIRVPLAGQQVAPDAYVNVFWDKEQNKAIIDASGLPEAPEGKEYQVWSLKLDPLTPTSIGLLSGFNQSSTKLFELSNPNETEAFGITLEPEGGSESPTLEQLYTLGAVGA